MTRPIVVEVQPRLTPAEIVSDADHCIEATPTALRASIEEMVLTFIDRLRRVDSLVPELARHVR